MKERGRESYIPYLYYCIYKLYCLMYVNVAHRSMLVFYGSLIEGKVRGRETEIYIEKKRKIYKFIVVTEVNRSC